jgi:hypothetical protein
MPSPRSMKKAPLKEMIAMLFKTSDEDKNLKSSWRKNTNSDQKHKGEKDS